MAHLRDQQLDLTRPRVHRGGRLPLRYVAHSPGAARRAQRRSPAPQPPVSSWATARRLDHVVVLLAQHLPNDLLDRRPVPTGGTSGALSGLGQERTIMSAAVAGPMSPPSYCLHRQEGRDPSPPAGCRNARRPAGCMGRAWRGPPGRCCAGRRNLAFTSSALAIPSSGTGSPAGWVRRMSRRAARLGPS